MASVEITRVAPGASEARAIYLNETVPSVRRALSLQDGNARSQTYGCCDRPYWQYRTLTGFAAATMQQLALPFAVLFTDEFPGNQWHHDATMLQRAHAAMLFWAGIQHPSGAFDEWYRNEQSYCATAFTTFGIAEALLRLRPHLPPEDVRPILEAIARAARWLRGRFNGLVMNQNLASCAALWNAAAVLDDRDLKQAFHDMWRKTVAHQDVEGWFPEYGGADVGYSLLALDLLGSLYARGWTDAVLPAQSLCRFLASFGYPGSDFAGGLGSRGTEHAFAYGAEIFAPHIPEASVVATHLRSGLSAKRLCRPETVDDRYLAYFYLPSYVLAASLGSSPVHADDTNAPPLRWPRAGLHGVRTRQSHIVCSSSRLGAFTICTEQSVHRNFGYWAETTDGRRWASCGWRAAVPAETPANQSIEVSGPFVAVEDALPLVRSDTAFHFVTHRLFRWAALAELFHRRLKDRKINRRRFGPFVLERALRWHSKGVTVRDDIHRAPTAPPLRSIGPVADIDVHSPSSRMSGSTGFASIVIPDATAREWAHRLNATNRLPLTATYEYDQAGQLHFASIRIEEI
jgi:hypothetical protein